MDINIDSRLKPLYANLLRLGIGKYLISENFTHLTIENNIDQLWDNCESRAFGLNSSIIVAIPGYTVDAENALGFFLMKLYNSNKASFCDILIKILIDFLEWSEEEKKMDKIKENLIDLGYDRNNVENALSGAKNVSVEVPTAQDVIEFKTDDLKIDKTLCFVLMPFDVKFDSMYENIIKKIIEDDEFELNCRRADEIFGTRPIIEDIWEYIKKSRILVAELTGRNPNVFYELGLAHAMNKNVILITQNLDDVPFDLKHYRCIVYEDSISGAENLKEALKNTLREQLIE